MGLYYRYGSYVFPVSSVQIDVQHQTTFRARGYPIPTRVTHAINHTLHSSDGTPTTLTTNLNTLLSAFNTQGLDAGLYHDAALTQPTAHVIVASQTFGGTRVVAIPFKHGDGTEYFNI